MNAELDFLRDFIKSRGLPCSVMPGDCSHEIFVYLLQSHLIRYDGSVTVMGVRAVEEHELYGPCEENE